MDEINHSHSQSKTSNLIAPWSVAREGGVGHLPPEIFQVGLPVLM